MQTLTLLPSRRIATLPVTVLNSGYTYFDRIAAESDGMTTLDYYASRYPHSTREEWRRFIEEGRITRKGEILRMDDRILPGQVLEYLRAPWDEPDVPSEIPILYRDEHVLVFDKPDGLPVIPGGKYLENSMVMIVRKTIDLALAPLHRLGRGTTGAILFTRTREAAVAFSRMMRERKIEKTYLALACGADLPDAFSIDTPIGRVPHPRLVSIHDVTPSGKTAVTNCTVLARQESDDTALLRVSIPTGRTHQIRIHLASIGHTLVGDAFYGIPNPVGDPDQNPSASALPGDPGYILHSWKLKYTDPFSGAGVEITAPVRREIIEWRNRAVGSAGQP